MTTAAAAVSRWPPFPALSLLVFAFRKKRLKSIVILATNIVSVVLVAFLLFKKAGMPNFQTHLVTEKMEDLSSRKDSSTAW